jgi:hypothetical protein
MMVKRLRLVLYTIILAVGLLTIFFYISISSDTATSLQSIAAVSFISFESNKNEQSSAKQTVTFDINKHVLIFVHVQKTGGSDFDRRIVKNLLIHNKSERAWTRACRNVSSKITFDSFQAKKVKFKKYECSRELTQSSGDLTNNWYFSRQTFGWACGLHADFSQLKNCVTSFYPNSLPVRDFRYFTILRDPVKRFLSEWLHVRRGATWIRKPHSDEQKCLNSHYKRCFSGTKTWANVSLEQFMNCESNLARNRQTRMLATFDADFPTCGFLNSPTDEFMDGELLERAKKSLENEMSFFALNEFQNLSAHLFERTFNGLFKFNVEFDQSNSSLSDSILRGLEKEMIERIERVNSLDIKLYKFAVSLFFKRLELYKIFY